MRQVEQQIELGTMGKSASANNIQDHIATGKRTLPGLVSGKQRRIPRGKTQHVDV